MKKYNEYEALKQRIIESVASFREQRTRPVLAIQTLAREQDISPFVVKKAMEELVEDGELIYSYRDPCSYVEIPCNGCDGEYRSARPMKVVTDNSGKAWLCDSDVKARDYLSSPGCWECGSLTFTRAG